MINLEEGGGGEVSYKVVVVVVPGEERGKRWLEDLTRPVIFHMLAPISSKVRSSKNSTSGLLIPLKPIAA